jgi:hypothetical protein
VVFAKRTTAPYVQPDMQRWLTQMGIGSATVLARPLTIYVDHAPNPVPQFINPSFFPNLLQVPPWPTQPIRCVCACLCAVLFPLLGVAQKGCKDPIVMTIFGIQSLEVS